MPLYLTENFFKLKEKIVQELSGEDQAVYGEPPVYYSRGNEESFHKAKKQLIFLLGKITAENESALVQLNVLKENVDKLTINCEDVEKEPLLIDLKKRFESLYCYNQHLLKHLRAEQFSDLTLGRCYQGAYSNAVMLIDRIIAGDGLTNYLLGSGF
ncbi:hypothetical protein [Piscirickettsia salmonis]|uniref:hypothetical protein n=1 Tax=Piscirickettsia salmonis TaxID=1238 RepID=UPI00069D61A4|nr:hypothetical protein [Piscirickettsia salmonis]